MTAPERLTTKAALTERQWFFARPGPTPTRGRRPPPGAHL